MLSSLCSGVRHAARSAAVPALAPQQSARHVHLYEWQSHKLMSDFGIRCAEGGAASTPAEAERLAESLGTSDFIVKAQILAGGRGKGKFLSGNLKGGVHSCNSKVHVRSYAEKMLGHRLVTKQTGPEGSLVERVLVCKRRWIRREFYFAIVLDRSSAGPMFVASAQGGMEIEEIAKEDPSAIIKEPIDPLTGPSRELTMSIADRLGFHGALQEQAASQFELLYKFFQEYDLTQLEINPLAETANDEVLCVDAKLSVDSNAMFRQPQLAAMSQGQGKEDPREIEAEKYDLNFIGLDGNIGCLVNGAGLAMATMDIIKIVGGTPANFLDIGGGASEKQVFEALRILHNDANVHAILVNIFGGIMRCDIIAMGLLNAVKNLNLQIPIIIRLEGTNMAEAKEIIDASGLKVIVASDLEDAARKAVNVANIIEMAKKAQLSVSFELPI